MYVRATTSIHQYEDYNIYFSAAYLWVAVRRLVYEQAVVCPNVAYVLVTYTVYPST